MIVFKYFNRVGNFYNRTVNRFRIFKFRFLGCQIGKNCLIGKNVTMVGCKRISIGDNVTIEENVKLKAGGYSNSENKYVLNIHNNIFIGYGCIFDANQFIELECYCMFGPYCFITDSNHIHLLNEKPFALLGGEYKDVLIKSNCWLGAHSIVLPGVVINENSIIAANSTVLRDVKIGTLNAGSPAVEKIRKKK